MTSTAQAGSVTAPMNINVPENAFGKLNNITLISGMINNFFTKNSHGKHAD